MTICYENELARSDAMVLREAQALYEGRGRLQQTYDRLASRLDALGVAFGLVGGYALVLHGVRRFTEDIDVLITAEDLSRLREALVGKGYRPVPGSSRSLRDADTGVRIDFVVSGNYPGDGKPKPVAFPSPETCLDAGRTMKVVDLRTLIELKLASGMSAPDRLQDLADVQRLIETHALSAAFADSLHPYVREAFRERAAAVAKRDERGNGP
jgi:hypothetical protein